MGGLTRATKRPNGFLQIWAARLANDVSSAFSMDNKEVADTCTKQTTNQ